ncbi:hypothetical protein T4E_9404 [Trichinella pseudospiralis]|uniref:PiggyBac transposable element-derived protein domain-containing protein n=2 Tax=Trichinella pseudospiralis TaxID=6337 RepID=A0A0V0YA94_TRIPS|nr:hypothetical protein T4E_9404 [Trichinella pseudospiralis]
MAIYIKRRANDATMSWDEVIEGSEMSGLLWRTLTSPTFLLFSRITPIRTISRFCQLPPNEDGNITDEEHIDEDVLDELIPTDVCGEVDVYIRHENVVDDLVVEEHAETQKLP